MAKEKTSPPAGDPTSPTVSVSEALGLPSDWNLRDAMAGVPGTEKPDKPVDDEPLPGEGEGAEGGAAEGAEGEGAAEGAEGGDGGEGEKPAGEKPAATKPGAKPAAKPAAKPGEKPGAKAAAKPGEKPAAPKPGTEKPNTGAKPVVPAKPAAAAPAPKIKVGDKEYTEEELSALLAKATAKPAAAEDPPAKPAAKEEPAKQPTPEEVTAQRAEVRKKDRAWVQSLAPSLDVPDIDEARMDKILAGGKEGIAEFHNVIREAAAGAILMTRKSMYAELQPVLDELRERQEPLITAQMEATDEREWATFSAKYEDLVQHRDLVENAAQVLVEKKPDHVKNLTMEQFQEEIAGEVRKFLKRFQPVAAPAAGEGEASAPAAGAEGGEGGAKPAAGAKPVAKPGAKPALPVRAKVAPPGANLPESTPGTGTKGAKGDAGIIASLW